MRRDCRSHSSRQRVRCRVWTASADCRVLLGDWRLRNERQGCARSVIANVSRSGPRPWRGSRGVQVWRSRNVAARSKVGSRDRRLQRKPAGRSETFSPPVLQPAALFALQLSIACAWVPALSQSINADVAPCMVLPLGTATPELPSSLARRQPHPASPPRTTRAAAADRKPHRRVLHAPREQPAVRGPARETLRATAHQPTTTCLARTASRASRPDRHCMRPPCPCRTV